MFLKSLLTRARIVAISLTAAMAAAALLLSVGPLAAATPASDPATAPSTPRLKACSEATPLFNVGPEFVGLTLTAIHRVCSNPQPMVSVSAGGIDPDSLGRSNFTSFLYGDCAPRGESGCPFPLEIQVWPTCERNPTTYQRATPVGDLGPDEVGGPRLVDQMSIRQAPVYVFGGSTASQTVAGAPAPDRVEAVVGESTVVIFTGVSGSGANVGRSDANSTLDDMLRAVRELRPAGTSIQPQRGAASSVSGALPSPAPGVLSGARTCVM